MKSLAREYRRHLVKEPAYLVAQPKQAVKLDSEGDKQSNEDTTITTDIATVDAVDTVDAATTDSPTSPCLPTWGNISAEEHLRTLHDLCSFLLSDLDRFALLPGYRDEGAIWRTDSLGADRHGATYWFIGDCWLYREHPRRRRTVPPPPSKRNSDQGNRGSTNTDTASTGRYNRSRTKKRPAPEPDVPEPETEAELESEWECVAWDTTSWRYFLEESSPFLTSRRPVDRELQTRLISELGPAACELLGREERQRRRREEELQRAALWESRQRSSRIAARERLHQQLVLHETSTIPLPVALPSRRPLRGRMGMGGGAALAANNAASPPRLTREERMALRAKRAQRRETEQIIHELMMQQERAPSEGDLYSESVDIEEQEQEQELEPVPGPEPEQEADDERESVSSTRSTTSFAPHSPIKLFLKIGPDGAARTDLFIANERIEKRDHFHQTPTSEQLGQQGAEMGMERGGDRGDPSPLPSIAVTGPPKDRVGGGKVRNFEHMMQSPKKLTMTPMTTMTATTTAPLSSCAQVDQVPKETTDSRAGDDRVGNHEQTSKKPDSHPTTYPTDQYPPSSSAALVRAPTEKEIAVANLLTDIASLLDNSNGSSNSNPEKEGQI